VLITSDDAPFPDRLGLVQGASHNRRSAVRPSAVWLAVRRPANGFIAMAGDLVTTHCTASDYILAVSLQLLKINLYIQ
jgi:hypothetical protein